MEGESKPKSLETFVNKTIIEPRLKPASGVMGYEGLAGVWAIDEAIADCVTSLFAVLLGVGELGVLSLFSW